MTDKTPEALALAGKLYDNGDVPSLEECSQAADLLCRQHQRIEALEKALERAKPYVQYQIAAAPFCAGPEKFLKEIRALLSTTQQEDRQA